MCLECHDQMDQLEEPAAFQRWWVRGQWTAAFGFNQVKCQRFPRGFICILWVENYLIWFPKNIHDGNKSTVCFSRRFWWRTVGQRRFHVLCRGTTAQKCTTYSFYLHWFIHCKCCVCVLFLDHFKKPFFYWKSQTHFFDAWVVCYSDKICSFQMFGNIVMSPRTNVHFDHKSTDKCDFWTFNGLFSFQTPLKGIAIGMPGDQAMTHSELHIVSPENRCSGSQWMVTCSTAGRYRGYRAFLNQRVMVTWGEDSASNQCHVQQHNQALTKQMPGPERISVSTAASVCDGSVTLVRTAGAGVYLFHV